MWISNSSRVKNVFDVIEAFTRVYYIHVVFDSGG